MKTTLATIRKHAKSPQSIDTGKNGNDLIFYYFGDLLPEQFCDDVNRSIKHTGWFTNEHGETFKDGSGKARGIVVALPARPGFADGVFLAGYLWGDNGERVYFTELHSCEIDAARYADGHAESFADDQREHDTKWNAARELEETIERLENRLCECFALRNHKKLKDIRFEVVRVIIAIRTGRETLTTDFAGVV